MSNENGLNRRRFLAAASAAVGAAGLGAAAIPFVRAMQPAQDIIAAGVIEVDLSDVRGGEMRTFLWRQQPVLILRRTPEMIERAGRIDPGTLKDPATPEERVQRPEWLVCLGVCTHLGCVPSLQPGRLPGFDQPGLLCPCHGGQYDTLGRRVAGPPPENLYLLPHEFLGDTRLRVGAPSFAGVSAAVRKLENLPKP